uniref:Uncharacterized protein n=1 Tax=Anguilla anguilla TaxID=7936 RepID=A0A0E9RGZ5_ANGAN
MKRFPSDRRCHSSPTWSNKITAVYFL